MKKFVAPRAAVMSVVGKFQLPTLVKPLANAMIQTKQRLITAATKLRYASLYMKQGRLCCVKWCHYGLCKQTEERNLNFPPKEVGDFDAYYFFILYLHNTVNKACVASFLFSEKRILRSDSNFAQKPR